MKHLLLGLIATTLLLTSCTSEEVITDTDNNNKMLESFEIKRNADGSYALTHEVRDGVATDYYDTKTQSEIYLYEKDGNRQTNTTRNYNIEENRLNVVFSDENNNELPKLSIVDDNTIGRGGELGLLDTYSIVFNQDGTAQLDFKVENGVDVAFGYNEDENINDIYLEEGTSTQLYYSQSYNKEPDGSLKIDFVQTVDRSTETKKPRFIYD